MGSDGGCRFSGWFLPDDGLLAYFIGSYPSVNEFLGHPTQRVILAGSLSPDPARLTVQLKYGRGLVIVGQVDQGGGVIGAKGYGGAVPRPFVHYR